MPKSSLSGRIWLLLNRQDDLIENIDTDQIYHNAHLHITDLAEMGKYALGNLEGWKDFPQKACPGDLLVAGRNFGAGSSRQQAVDCFISLQIGAILSPSFGAIYFRNAVNSGFPILRCPEIKQLIRSGILETGDEIRIHFLSGDAQIINKNVSFQVLPMSDVQYEIFQAGSLFDYGRSQHQE
jgi:3-isopropylmalate/(R)-2-methylmalate dehydratase small subunit